MKKLGEGSYFIRLAVSFLALATIALVLSIFIIYKNYENETIKENEAVSEQMLSQTVYGADLIWDWASMHAIELYNNGHVFNAIYGTNLSPVDEMNAQTVLSYAMSSNPYIYSIYLYNESVDKVFSTISKGYAPRDFFDQDILEILKDKSLYSQYQFIPRKIKFIHYDKSYEEDVISLIVTESLAENKPANGAFILNIKVSTIKNLIESYIPSKGNSFVIFDKNSKVISHTDSSMFQKDLSEEDYVIKIKSSVKSSGYFTDTINGKEYLITYVKSDKLKWSFARLKPYASLFEKTYGMRSLVIVLVLLVFLLIVFFSLWLSWKFYKPYNKAVENSNSLRKQYYDNKDFLRREFLKSLLCGELPYYNDVGRKFEELDIKLKTQAFAVLLLTIDNYRTDFCTKNNEKDAALFKFAIGNIAQEIVSSEYMCEAVDMGADVVAVIFNPVRKAEKDLEDKDYIKDNIYEKMTRMVSQIRNAVEEYFSINISGAVGQPVESLVEIPASYRSALEISDYRILYGMGSLITHTMVSENVNRTYTYSDDTENEMINCLKLRNYAAIEAKTDEFFSSIRTISYDDMFMSVNRLLYASIKAITGIWGKKNPEFNYRTAWDKIESMSTLEEIHKWFLELYRTIIVEGNDVNDNVKRKHVDRVVNIVKQEYSDPNLSTDGLAERLGLSSNYLREIFRDSMGVTMSNYINEIRCERASEMLLETSLSIAEISDRIGLSNQNYFFTLFKKFKNLTPQQYRNRGRDRSE